MDSFHLIVSLLGFFVVRSTAVTDLQQQILGTVVYTINGDRTPQVFPEQQVLTPLGAQQLYDLGTQMRDRYVTPGQDISIAGTHILNISPYQINMDDLFILTNSDPSSIASAQAFMQGLYPPLAISSGYVYIEGQSMLANQTNVVAPLEGYQYPFIQSVSAFDLDSIWLAGSANCPAQDSSVEEYYGSPQYLDLQQSSQSFYDGLKQDVLDGVFIDGSIGFYDAYSIYDYLQYQFIHNATTTQSITEDVLTQARSLADQWAFAVYGDLTAASLTGQQGIRAIGGSTFANQVLRLLETNIDTAGTQKKMSLMFGSYETMVSFASLAQLPNDGQPEFTGLPNVGSSMVFELFSLFVEESDHTYPDRSNMYVRFLFQNGTDAELIGYPLFGRGNSEIIMSLDDFVTGMESIEIMSIADWCIACNSYDIFCPAVEGVGVNNPSSGSDTSNSSGSNGGLSPAIAGVIGAVIALALVGLVLAAVMVLGGIRFFRKRTHRNSELKGFKGAEKLASDQDLTLPKGGAGATIVPAGTAPARGHERVGSWELRDAIKAEEEQLPQMHGPPFMARKPSYEDDDLQVNAYNRPVKPRDQV